MKSVGKEKGVGGAKKKKLCLNFHREAETHSFHVHATCNGKLQEIDIRPFCGKDTTSLLLIAGNEEALSGFYSIC